jgi:hypothetical protein
VPEVKAKAKPKEPLTAEEIRELDLWVEQRRKKWPSKKKIIENQESKED